MIILTNSKMNDFHYKKWIACFKSNDRQRLDIDFSKELPLTDSDRELITPSIRAFQQGEGSDGRHLMKSVETYIQKHGTPEYREAMLLFIKEENWHSAYLKKFMDHHHIQPARSSILDKIFRKLRQAGGLKCEITVLVTAEMIALTYYDALSKSTDSPALKSICAQMLHDELPHIMFQSYTLSRLKKYPFDNLARMVIMVITLLFVWMQFHNVYRAGGYNFTRFLKENLGYLRQSILLTGRKRAKFSSL